MPAKNISDNSQVNLNSEALFLSAPLIKDLAQFNIKVLGCAWPQNPSLKGSHNSMIRNKPVALKMSTEVQNIIAKFFVRDGIPNGSQGVAQYWFLWMAQQTGNL